MWKLYMSSALKIPFNDYKSTIFVRLNIFTDLYLFVRKINQAIKIKNNKFMFIKYIYFFHERKTAYLIHIRLLKGYPF